MTEEAGHSSKSVASLQTTMHNPRQRRMHRYTADKMISTNTVEVYYSIFKLGMKGAYQRYSEKHLHRYLAEFDFRYCRRVKLGSSNAVRSDKALQGIVGKRLTYRRPRKTKIN